MELGFALETLLAHADLDPEELSIAPPIHQCVSYSAASMEEFDAPQRSAQTRASLPMLWKCGPSVTRSPSRSHRFTGKGGNDPSLRARLVGIGLVIR